MPKPTGFLEFDRQSPPKRPVSERVADYREVERMMPSRELIEQAARCMDCGIPYCHSFGCPLLNRIPDWNDMVYQGQWRKALELLHATGNFPEITGRVCPAPCEAACTLMIREAPVSIRHIELQIVERGWQEGWIQPQPPAAKSGCRVAVIGSGPAGLAASQQLARAGHRVVLYEKDDRIGGLLRYGIPDFKLEKWVLDRRIEQMRLEGVVFENNVRAGVDVSVSYLQNHFDAILITTGSRVPRDLTVPGRGLRGVHFAMEFLAQSNRRIAGDAIPADAVISAEGKDVVVIGGGDTGSDCIGTSRRQGARSITQLELLPQPPENRPLDNPWPLWPQVMRTSTSQEEGCERLWSISTKEFIGEGGVRERQPETAGADGREGESETAGADGGKVRGLKCVRLEWSEPDATGRRSFKEIAGSEFGLPGDLVLLAMGFVHTEHHPLVSEFGLRTDERGNILVDRNFMTSVNGVFAAGDSTKGQSLVVHALYLGRQAAAAVDRYLAVQR
jgi:NAD(P)H-dependent glutamate synthase small subunit